MEKHNEPICLFLPMHVGQGVATLVESLMAARISHACAPSPGALVNNSKMH